MGGFKHPPDPVSQALLRLAAWRLFLAGFAAVCWVLPWSVAGVLNSLYPVGITFGYRPEPQGVSGGLLSPGIAMAAVLPLGLSFLCIQKARELIALKSLHVFQFGMMVWCFDAVTCLLWGCVHWWSTRPCLLNKVPLDLGNSLGLATLGGCVVVSFIHAPWRLYRALQERHRLAMLVPPEEDEDVPEVLPISEAQIQLRSMDPVNAAICLSFGSRFWHLPLLLFPFVLPWQTSVHHREESGLAFWFGAGQASAPASPWPALGGLLLLGWHCLRMLHRVWHSPSLHRGQAWRVWHGACLFEGIGLALTYASLHSALRCDSRGFSHLWRSHADAGSGIYAAFLLLYATSLFVGMPIRILRNLRRRSVSTASGPGAGDSNATTAGGGVPIPRSSRTHP